MVISSVRRVESERTSATRSGAPRRLASVGFGQAIEVRGREVEEIGLDDVGLGAEDVHRGGQHPAESVPTDEGIEEAEQIRQDDRVPGERGGG